MDFWDSYLLYSSSIFKNAVAWLQVGCSDFRFRGLPLPRTEDFLLRPDLILSSFATVSIEVSFLKAVSHAAAVTSV